jgi:transposase
MNVVLPAILIDAIQALTKDQFDALVLGLPWQRLEQMRVITRM